jgi:hypothetical protein
MPDMIYAAPPTMKRPFRGFPGWRQQGWRIEMGKRRMISPARKGLQDMPVWPAGCSFANT